MRVLVLGCGPAGLMAAHAAKVSGADRVDIYSKRRKSELFGAQYLHQPIPGMTDTPPVTVEYVLEGSAEDYRRKVYGADWDGEVSPEDLIGNHDGWDIRRTYDNLWLNFGATVWNTNISPGYIGNIMDEARSGRWDLVISSVPKPLLCGKHHTFNSKPVWALGDAPERGLFVVDYIPKHRIYDNTVICNGNRTPTWYRRSRVFGYDTVEWPQYSVENWPNVNPTNNASKVNKPLDNNCDCWPDILHVGRFGKWEKGILSHTAYQDVLDKMVVEPVA